jgi:hypothetical protein
MPLEELKATMNYEYYYAQWQVSSIVKVDTAVPLNHSAYRAGFVAINLMKGLYNPNGNVES